MTSQAHQSVLQMETDVLAVRRWADVLSHLGSSEDAVEAGGIHVIAMALAAVGQRLERDWNDAHKAVRGDQ